MNEQDIGKLQRDVKRLEEEIQILKSALLHSTAMTVSVLSVATSDDDERVAALKEVRKNLRIISRYASSIRPIGQSPELGEDSARE